MNLKISDLIQPLFFALLGFFFIGLGLVGFQQADDSETDYFKKSLCFQDAILSKLVH